MLDSGFDPNRVTTAIAAEKPGFFSTIWMKVLLVVAGSIVTLIIAVFASLYVAVSFFGLRAFVTPSDSMCPTICMNERFLASMDPYGFKGPARGEVIMFRHGEGNTLYVKRVAAIGGDTISAGPNNSVLVNGKPLANFKVCGKSRSENAPSAPSPFFPTTTVPERSLFVLGDNLGNSYDSRIPEYGFVTLDQVKAKPLFLYWSPAISRIGCRIQ